MVARVIPWRRSAHTVGVLALCASIATACNGRTPTSDSPDPPIGAQNVASINVSPASLSLIVGDTQDLSATAKDAGGSVVSGASFTWASDDSSVATVDTLGKVTAQSAGSATITATSEGVSGIATVVVAAPAATDPATVSDLQFVSSTDSSVTLQWTEVDDGTGGPANYALRYGSPTISWGNASGTEVLLSGHSVGSIRTYTSIGLQAGTPYQFQLAAYRGTPNVNAAWGALSNVASGQTATASQPPPSEGQQLVSEGFEDGNLGSRGWFDVRTPVSIANDHRPGSSGTHALEWHWATGTIAPPGAARIDFTPSNSMYFSYWIKFSSNWIGSGKAYHPHLFSIFTTADDHYIGPAISHLTVYDEMLYLNGNLVANLMIQDALMIDISNLNVDLFGVTEQHSIGGYNGKHEFDDSTSTVSWDLYRTASTGKYTNYKMIRPRGITIADADKDQWHHIESYWQLNSIVNGIGQQDGVLQYWVDGVLRVDRHNVYYRTGANPTMQFRTVLMAPYIGDGSPVDQYIWVDDLLLATKRP